MCSEGRRSEFGGTGGTHGHILLCPAKVDRIDNVFDQKVVKNGQKGVHPVFTGGFFPKFAGTLDPLPPRNFGSMCGFCPRGMGPIGQQRPPRPQSEVGGRVPKVPARFGGKPGKNRVYPFLTVLDNFLAKTGVNLSQFGGP